MKKSLIYSSLGIILVFCLSCSNKSKTQLQEYKSNHIDTVYIHDTIYIDQFNNKDWQKSFGLTHDPNIDSIWFKPVSYYLEDKECSPIAFEFYYGYIKPSDNGTTIELLKLAKTDNNKLRPFYRWCLNKTLIVSDGALGELVGVPARQYAEKFPDEFFNYLDIANNDGQYEMWTNAIAYSGYFDFDEYDNDKLNTQRLEKTMFSNLKNKSTSNINRVKKFAKDCVFI